MHRRVPIFLACLAFALLVAGCGESTTSTGSSSGNAPKFASPSDDTGSAGSGDTKSGDTKSGDTGSAKSASEAAKQACLDAAERMADSQKAEVRRRCKKTYNSIDNSKAIKDAMAQAAKRCREAVEQIPDAAAKAQAMKTCEKFK